MRFALQNAKKRREITFKTAQDEKKASHPLYITLKLKRKSPD